MRDKLGKRKVYAKRDKMGRFKDIQSIKKSMAIDKGKTAKSSCKPGNCYKGDRKPSMMPKLGLGKQLKPVNVGSSMAVKNIMFKKKPKKKICFSY